MIKRIIILALIYTIVILFLTLNMDKLGNLYVFLLLIFSIIFAIFIISFIYKKHLKGFKPKNSEILYSTPQTSDNQLKKISTRPFLFGLEKKFISDDELFFDEEHFYAVNNKNQKATFKLADITEISKTSLQINNRRLWQVKIKQDNGKEIVFKFAHNYTLWNKNFLDFYEKIKSINPTVVKTKWNLWSM